jgi:hypothetical protein
MSETIEKLRKAVAAGAHSQAAVLLRLYRAELDSELVRLQPNSEEAVKLAREARDLFEWARRMTLAARSRMESGRRTLPRPCPYLNAPASRRTWSLEG